MEKSKQQSIKGWTKNVLVVVVFNPILMIWCHVAEHMCAMASLFGSILQMLLLFFHCGVKLQNWLHSTGVSPANSKSLVLLAAPQNKSPGYLNAY